MTNTLYRLCLYCEKESPVLTSAGVCPECANAQMELMIEREEKQKSQEELKQQLSQARLDLDASKRVSLDALLCGYTPTPNDVRRFCQRAERLLELLDERDEQEDK